MFVDIKYWWILMDISRYWLILDIDRDMVEIYFMK